MKRFWDTAALAADGAQWQVLLDGRPMRLPGGGKLAIPHRGLAAALAAEWQDAGGAKGGEMTFADVPLTRLAGTAQERIAPDPEPVALELARYAESDLLCYRADIPVALARRQATLWQPWLDWAAQRHAAQLKVTTGIIHVAQDPIALAALATAVASHDPLGLAGLGVAVPALGSLVLGLAIADGALEPAAAHDLAMLDELFQESQWGHDEDAALRRSRVGADIAVAGRFLALVNGR